MPIITHSKNKNKKVDWLDAFVEKSIKKADLGSLDPDEIQNKLSNSHNSVEDKMADIKSRIGFDVVIATLSPELNKKTAKCDCDKCDCVNCKCDESCKCCSTKNAKKLAHKKEDVELMAQCLKYIRSIVQHEPHLTTSSVIERCRAEDGLYFNDLPINHKKLRGYIDKLTEKNSFQENVSYHPPSDHSNNQMSSRDDDIADYYNHSKPS